MTDPYGVGTHEGRVTVHEVDGKHWWACSCGVTAPHGRTSRRAARRDGDKHLNRAITNRPSRRERETIMNRVGGKPLEAGGPAQAVALPSKPEPFRGDRRAPDRPGELAEAAPAAGSISSRKPLVLVWHTDESDPKIELGPKT